MTTQSVWASDARDLFSPFGDGPLNFLFTALEAAGGTVSEVSFLGSIGDGESPCITNFHLKRIIFTEMSSSNKRSLEAYPTVEVGDFLLL